MDYSLPSSSVHGISQTGILQWVAISFYMGSSWFSDQTCFSCIAAVSCIAGRFFTSEPGKPPQVLCCAVLSHFGRVRLFVTLWTAACQTPLSVGFSRQERWSGLSCPPPGDLPDPGIELLSFTSPALAGGFFTTSATWEAPSGVEGTTDYTHWSSTFFINFPKLKFHRTFCIPIFQNWVIILCMQSLILEVIIVLLLSFYHSEMKENLPLSFGLRRQLSGETPAFNQASCSFLKFFHCNFLEFQ